MGPFFLIGPYRKPIYRLGLIRSRASGGVLPLRAEIGQERSFDADAQIANNRNVRVDIVLAGLSWPTPYRRSVAVAWLERGLSIDDDIVELL
jgi:hypothetical protein